MFKPSSEHDSNQVQSILRPCSNVQTRFKPGSDHVNHAQNVFKPCPDHVQTPIKPGSNHAQTMLKPGST
eukprot:10231467-Lingulodinium_polyedra.AAC.1